jgi:quercetin dioxygenase-like cupin family protein
MRRLFALAASAAVIASVSAFGQESKLAPEGRGLLPKPAGMPAALGGTPPPHPFERDPSGGFSRTIFETDENPDFKIIIRDFSFPPDKQTHTFTLPSAAFVHFLSGSGNIIVAKKQVDLSSVARTAVPAGAPVEVVNNGQYPVVVRALIVEAK